MRCSHCGGRVVPDHEDARDEPVMKCLACSRYATPPRPHEEPPKHKAQPRLGLSAVDAHERQKRQGREYWQRKKAAGAA
jgi:hypothetical protein